MLWCSVRLFLQQGIGGAVRDQEEFLLYFLPGAPGAFEAGGDDFVDVAAVHLGPFVEHAGAADDFLDIPGKLVEFFPAVVKAPGDGFVDFDPGVVFRGALELPGFMDERVQGAGRGREAFDVRGDEGVKRLVDQGIGGIGKDLLPDLGEDIRIPVPDKGRVDGGDGGEDAPGFFHVHRVYPPPGSM